MEIGQIISEIDSEIAKLQRARAILRGLSGQTITSSTAKAAEAPKRRGRKRRKLSAEARKRIAEAQRKRWAAQKAKTTKKTNEKKAA